MEKSNNGIQQVAQKKLVLIERIGKINSMECSFV
jgi:hypothetical protein